MNRPKVSTYVVGHPIVLLFATTLLVFGIYRWTKDPTSWPLTAIAFGFGGAWSSASGKVDAYRNWKRAWDEMEGRPTPPPSRRLRDWIMFLGGLGLLLILLDAAGKLPQPKLIAYSLGAVAVSIVVWRLLRRLTRRTKPARPETSELVAVCIKGPVLQIPSLEQAFSALPAHCRSVLHPKNGPTP